MKHFTKEELELFRHNEVSFFQKILIKRHLKKCSQCTETLAQLQEEDLFIADLRDSVRLFQTLSEKENTPALSDK